MKSGTVACADCGMPVVPGLLCSCELLARAELREDMEREDRLQRADDLCERGGDPSDVECVDPYDDEVSDGTDS